ncbi:hypothetical protein PG984_003866 [Apiospora sp. TS-2023a]
MGHASHGILLEDCSLLLEVAPRDLLLVQMVDQSTLVLDMRLVAIDQGLGLTCKRAVIACDVGALLVVAGFAMSSNTLGALLFTGLGGGISGPCRRRSSGSGRVHDEVDDLECLALDRGRVIGGAEAMNNHGSKLERRTLE